MLPLGGNLNGALLTIIATETLYNRRTIYSHEQESFFLNLILVFNHSITNQSPHYNKLSLVLNTTCILEDIYPKLNSSVCTLAPCK